MNEVHKTTLKDRIKAAIAAFKGKPAGFLSYGIRVTRCEDCNRRDLSRIVNLIGREIEKSYSCREAEYRAGLHKALDIIGEEAHR